KGVINGQPHAVQAIVKRSYTYPFAIFSKTVTDFSGNTGNYDSNTCTGPVETVDDMGNTSCSNPPADLATDGQINCTGSTSPARQQDFYKGGGTTCQNGYLLPGTYNPKDPVVGCPAPVNIPTTPCIPTSPVPTCPATNGVFWASVPAGNYLCTEADAVGKTPTLT